MAFGLLSSSHAAFRSYTVAVSSDAPTDSLLHHLKFLAGDLTGSTIKNWGSGANATSNGTNAITGGVCTFGGASNAYIRLGGTYTVAYGTSITTSMYFKSNKAEVTNVNLFLSTLNSWGDGILYELNPNGSIGVQVNTVTNNAQNYRTSNVWNHIAVVYTFSSVSTSISLYVNGVLTGIGTSGPQSATNVRNSFIGHATWDANQFIVGSIRNFRWYSRALNTTEIATLATVD